MSAVGGLGAPRGWGNWTKKPVGLVVTSVPPTGEGPGGHAAEGGGVDQDDGLACQRSRAAGTGSLQVAAQRLDRVRGRLLLQGPGAPVHSPSHIWPDVVGHASELRRAEVTPSDASVGERSVWVLGVEGPHRSP